MGWMFGKRARRQTCLGKAPNHSVAATKPSSRRKPQRCTHQQIVREVPGCTVHGDGARAWKSESKRLRLRFKNVVHCKMQFSKLVRVRRLPKLTGTQCLDQTWKQLKRYIPKELRSRDQTTRRDNHRLEEYVWSFLFRMNVRPKLLEALGKLAQKANNATR